MSSTGGSRESESVLVALRSVLHRGQFLIGLEVWRWVGFYERRGTEKGHDILEYDVPCI